MGAMSWTAEQQSVIDARKRNLLVSAAAGSGKTAVLVERIIRMVTDPADPVDIDRLLVMTFTNAAAAEMRERIGAAIEARLEADPGNRNLERQATLLHHAKITTIDSFCLGLLREHFQALDLDPGFRVGEEGELLLLQADVMKDLLEESYAEKREDFIRFVDAYASGKADAGLDDYILQVWRFAQSNPWPGEWIAGCLAETEEGAETGESAETEESAESEESAETEIGNGSGQAERGSEDEGSDRESGKAASEPAWIRYLIADVARQAAELRESLAEALAISREEDGPQSYEPVLANELAALTKLSKLRTYREIHRALSDFTFERLKAPSKKTTAPEKKDRAKELRDRVKKSVETMKKLYVPGSYEEIFSDLASCREPIRVLLGLAQEFGARYQEAKEEKNLVDFNDLEHFALEILTGGSADHTPGPVADELSEYFAEILVDEYQDSNEVQETLIRCISRERFGTPNVFMVGDVKQSIYRFRLAKPELFLEKYSLYPKEEGAYQKIELHKNFRSRPEVLASVNDLFRGIMTEALGGIRYTDDAALYPGAAYPETETPGAAVTELILLDTGEAAGAGAYPSSGDDAGEQADYTAKETEARFIAGKIRELTDPKTGMKIWNAKSGQYEPLRKKDIVILLRSLSGWSEEFVSVLTAEGIPAFAESRTGYFNAIEVETVLNMLALIDNPMQDIPLAGVLRSPIGGLSDRELAIIGASWKRKAVRGQDGGLCGAVRSFLEDQAAGGEDPERSAMDETAGETYGKIVGEASVPAEADREVTAIAGKLTRFSDLLSALREEAEYLPVHRLLYRIFELTGYYDYVSAMPAGRTRQANLNMLVEKAAAYEKTSYQSLFDFIRYIEKLKKYNTDFGEAARLGEDADTVRIMSIHKSKGLEFPVVFLAGAGKAFNRQDSRGKILIDEELGIATDFLDTELKVKAPTLKKKVVGRRRDLESMGEELRILYVAMTRAKEKLIITAAADGMEKRIDKWSGFPAGELPFTAVSGASGYLDWLFMASAGTKDSIKTVTVPVSGLVGEEIKKQTEKLAFSALLAKLRREPEPGEEETGQFSGGLIEKTYPYAADLTLHAKMSVSELKEQGQFLDDGESDFLPTIPDFMMRDTGEKERSAAPDMSGEKNGAQTDQTAVEATAKMTTEMTVETASKTAEPTVETVAGTGQENAHGPQSGAGGAYRGTAYHRVMELLDFKRTGDAREIKEQLKEFERTGRMDPKALKLIRPEKLVPFFGSELAGRMRRADLAGKLYKERQFVMGIPAREMDEADSDEPVLIQGIIDAYFEEADGLVLMDYKTDRVPKNGEQILLDRYTIQMVYYVRALEQLTGKRVKEVFLYSFALQKAVRVVFAH